jgi:hypothetical protein
MAGDSQRSHFKTRRYEQDHQRVQASLLTGTGSNVTYTQPPDNTCLTATDLPKHKAAASATWRLA